MKKLSLRNVQLGASNLLSNEEKKQVVGGERIPWPLIDDNKERCPVGFVFECGYCADPTVLKICMGKD